MSGNSKVEMQQVTLTPISNSSCLFRTRIEHGSDDQKSRIDRSFAHPKDQANCKQAPKAFAGGMTAQRDSPNSDVEAGNMMNYRPNAPCKMKADLIHFATGNLCKHKFCGYTKTR